MSMHLDITATLSSKFSVKTIDFASQNEICNTKTSAKRRVIITIMTYFVGVVNHSKNIWRRFLFVFLSPDQSDQFLWPDSPVQLDIGVRYVQFKKVITRNNQLPLKLAV